MRTRGVVAVVVGVDPTPAFVPAACQRPTADADDEVPQRKIGMEEASAANRPVGPRLFDGLNRVELVQCDHRLVLADMFLARPRVGQNTRVVLVSQHPIHELPIDRLAR